MSVPSGPGAPCRFCLGALVIEVEAGTWSCDRGLTHTADDDKPAPPSSRDLAVAEAFALVADELRTARETWEADGKPSALEALSAAVDILVGAVNS